MTLNKMAASYGKSPKTFSRIATRLGIPFEQLGSTKYFDPAEVSLYLRQVPVSDNVVKLKPRKTKRTSTRFAEMVGI